MIPPCFFWGFPLREPLPQKSKQKINRLFECRLSYIYCKVRMLCSRSLVFAAEVLSDLNIGAESWGFVCQLHQDDPVVISHGQKHILSFKPETSLTMKFCAKWSTYSSQSCFNSCIYFWDANSQVFCLLLSLSYFLWLGGIRVLLVSQELFKP